MQRSKEDKDDDIMMIRKIQRMRDSGHSVCASDDNKCRLLTAVLFIGHVSTVVVTVTDPRCCDTAARLGTLELVVTTPYQHTSHNTRTLNILLNDTTWYQMDKLTE